MEEGLFSVLSNEMIVKIIGFLEKSHDIKNFACSCKRARICVQREVGRIGEIYTWAEFGVNTHVATQTIAEWAVDAMRWSKFEKLILLRKLYGIIDGLNEKMVSVRMDLSEKSLARSKRDFLNQQAVRSALNPVLLHLKQYSLVSEYNFIEEQGTLNAMNEEGLCILQLLLYKKEVGLSNMLLNAGANIDFRNREKTTVLYNAVSDAHIDIVKFLLDAKSNPDISDSQGRTALHRAVIKEQVEIVKCLLMADAKVDMVDKGGWTALHWAVIKNNLDLVKELLVAKANVNTNDNEDRSALEKATGTKLEIITLLLQSKAEIRNPVLHSWSVVHLSAIQNKFENFHGNLPQIDPDIKDRYGMAPLHWAVSLGNINVSAILIEKIKTNVNLKDIMGRTPLHVCVETNNPQIMVLLLKSIGIKVDKTNSNGKTALHLATMGCNVNIVQMLLLNRANVNAKDRNKQTPLHYAGMLGNITVMKLLLETKRVKVNAKDLKQRTPLHEAAKAGHHDMVTLLLSYGACLNATDIDGNTAANLAKLLNHTDLKLEMDKTVERDSCNVM